MPHLDGRLPLTEDTRLRLYSVSKTFTIAGFLKLYEKGFFSLDDPVSRYLPEFSHPVVCLSKEDISQVEPAKRPITIRHLLTMTSGIPYMGLSLGAGLVEDAYYEKIDNMLAKVRQGEQYRLKDFVRMIADIPPLFPPGEQWMYGFSSRGHWPPDRGSQRQVLGAVFKKRDLGASWFIKNLL